MKKYLEQYSVVLPGRLSGINRQTTEILPTDCTKLNVCPLLQMNDMNDIKQLWEDIFPSVVGCRRTNDFCWAMKQSLHFISM